VITADEVAKILGIRRGAVYDLAAPRGPSPARASGAGASDSTPRMSMRSSRRARLIRGALS
jgi:hypothetical protein